MVKLFQQMFRFIFPYLLQGVLSIFLAIPIVRAAPTNDLRLITFQQFIQHRPAYVQGVVQDRVVGLSTNIYFIKWQQNAYFYGKMPKKFHSMDWPKDIKEFGSIETRWNNEYWRVHDNAFEAWTNHGNPNEMKLFLRVDNEYIPATLLNLGQNGIRIHDMHWENGQFVGTNQTEGFVLRGTPIFNSQGKISIIYWQRIPRGWFKKKPPKQIWRYFYEDNQFPNLPSRIEYKTANLQGEIRIHWIALSSYPRSREEFALRLEDFLPRVEVFITPSNNVMVSYLLKEGQSFTWKPPKPKPKPKKAYKTFLIILVIVIISLPLIYLMSNALKRKSSSL